MIIEQPLQTGQPRRNVWCSTNELVDNNDGTYSFVELPLNALGYGSKVYVIDMPNTIFYYDDQTGLLYPWSASASYVLPVATSTTLGGIKVGYGLTVTDEVMSVKPATTDVIGGVVVGDGLYIDSTGLLSVSNTGVLYVGKATETMSTSETTKTVNFTGNFVTAFATMNGVKVGLDIDIGSSSVVFSVAEEPDSAILCTVIYGEAAS